MTIDLITTRFALAALHYYKWLTINILLYIADYDILFAHVTNTNFKMNKFLHFIMSVGPRNLRFS